VRPTIEWETVRFSRRSSTTSLALPQRGYWLRKDRTRSANSGVHVGRRICERRELSSRVVRSWWSNHRFQPLERLATDAKRPTHANHDPAKKSKQYPLEPRLCCPP